MIRDFVPADVSRIVEIYNYYIKETAVTFEYDPITAEEVRQRMKEILEKGFSFVVYEKEGTVVGFAYLNTWRKRMAYAITMESSLYLDPAYVGSGIGSDLYQALIDRARKIHVHSLIGVISLPNERSRSLHRKFKFELVGTLKESGVKFGKLIDVELWQLIL